jgi:serine/threonine-protein kinase
MDAEKTPEPLAALAAANAETDHFEEAVKWQTKAIELIKDEKTKKEARQRLELYQAGKPYRAPRPEPASASK